MNTAPAAMPPVIWAFLAGNFVIGTGAMMVAGMMNQLASDLQVSVAQAAQLLTAFAIVCGVGAPIFAAVLTRYSRRTVLTGSLLLYAAGHALAALTHSYVLLLAIRAFCGVGAAIFTPQAAAAAGTLVAPAQRGKAVGVVFLGWSAASVVGVPLGSTIAATLHWQVAMWGVAGLAVLSAAAVWFYTPASLVAQKVDFAAFMGVLKDRRVMPVVGVTVLSATGLFCMFAYLAPLYKTVMGASPAQISLLFGAYGLAGLLGSVWMSRNIDRMGAARFVGLCLASTAAVLLAWPLAALGFAAALVIALLWGGPGFATNGAQQARVVGMSGALAPIAVACNSSAIYLGQALGTVIGGIYYSLAPALYLPWLAACFVVAAWVLSHALRTRHNV